MRITTHTLLVSAFALGLSLTQACGDSGVGGQSSNTSG